MIEKVGEIAILCSKNVVCYKTLDMLLELKMPSVVVLHGIQLNEIDKKYFQKNIFFLHCSRMQASNLAGALNYGLAYAERLGFSHVRRIDAGDQILKDEFELNNDFVDKTNNILYVYDRNRAISSILRTFIFDNPFVHSTLYIKLNQGVNYDETLDYAQDFDLYLRYWTKISQTPKFDIVKNFSLTGSSKTKRKQQLRCSITAIRKSNLTRLQKFILVTFRNFKIFGHWLLS